MKETGSSPQEKAFEHFYLHTFPRVYAAAYAFTGRRDPAWDATQEAFSRAFARWPRLHNKEWRAGWVMTTALNLCKRRGISTAPLEAAMDIGDYSPPLSSVPGAVDVAKALQVLPKRQRQAVILFYMSDLSLAQVADLMNVSEGAVKAHLHKARQALKSLLAVRHA